MHHLSSRIRAHRRKMLSGHFHGTLPRTGFDREHLSALRRGLLPKQQRLRTPGLLPPQRQLRRLQGQHCRLRRVQIWIPRNDLRRCDQHDQLPLQRRHQRRLSPLQEGLQDPGQLRRRHRRHSSRQQVSGQCYRNRRDLLHVHFGVLDGPHNDHCLYPIRWLPNHGRQQRRMQSVHVQPPTQRI